MIGPEFEANAEAELGTSVKAENVNEATPATFSVCGRKQDTFVR